MALRNIRVTRASFVHPTMAADKISHHDDQEYSFDFEFDESDIFYENDRSPARNPIPVSRFSKKTTRAIDTETGWRMNKVMTSASAPVSIPDWSQILKGSYVKRGKRESDETEEDVEYSGEDDGGGIRVPPHEYLAKRNGDSSSVHEGIGRTLKGRDLSRVRNAVWMKLGFID